MVEEHKVKEEATNSVIIDDQGQENQNVNGSDVAIPVNHEGLENLNEKLNEYMEKCQSGGYKCKLCGKMSGLKNAKQNMTFHVETHIEGLSFTCQICQKSFRSRGPAASWQIINLIDIDISRIRYVINHHKLT